MTTLYTYKFHVDGFGTLTAAIIGTHGVRLTASELTDFDLTVPGEVLDRLGFVYGEENMVHLGLGWNTFGQALPPGFARSGLQVGGLGTQSDVKCRWGDGSIRFAILTVESETEGDFPLQAGPVIVNTFPDTPQPDFWLQITDLQSPAVYVLRPQWDQASDRWLDGPLCREKRQWLVPNYNGQDHPFLRVCADLRQYRDGSWSCDFVVENCLDSDGSTVVYNASLGVGSVRFIDRDNLRHSYLRRWRQVVLWRSVGQWVQGEAVPDLGLMIQAGAVPSYIAAGRTQDSWVGGDFAVLGRGLLDPNMPAHGGRSEIAPYPDWTARYLAHRDPVLQRRLVLAHGDLAGSWPVHVRNDDGSLVSLDARPGYWWYSEEDGPRGRPLPPVPYSEPTADHPLVPDNAHQPSLAYVPYLLTGDRYYADEMAFWANYVLLSSFPDERIAAGLLWGNEVRGFAWGLRNLVDAAAYLPDADPAKAYFTAKVRNNLAWLDIYANTQNNPLGILWVDRRPENTNETTYDRAWIALWEQNYLAWAIDHANKQGFAGGLIHRDRIVGLQHALFFDPATRDRAAPYLLPVGDRVPPGSGNVEWYGSLAQCLPELSAFAGNYGTDARLSLLLAEQLGLLNAAAHRTWLESQPGMQAYLEDRLGFYVATEWKNKEANHAL